VVAAEPSRLRSKRAGPSGCVPTAVPAPRCFHRPLHSRADRDQLPERRRQPLSVFFGGDPNSWGFMLPPGPPSLRAELAAAHRPYDPSRPGAPVRRGPPGLVSLAPRGGPRTLSDPDRARGVDLCTSFSPVSVDLVCRSTHYAHQPPMCCPRKTPVHPEEDAGVGLGSISVIILSTVPGGAEVVVAVPAVVAVGP